MKELTKAEDQIMQILWKLKKAFVNDIIDHPSSSQTRLQYSEHHRSDFGNKKDLLIIKPMEKHTSIFL